ncbi:N-6 DNA methylase [Aeromonas veronii bv. sobria]|uniref:site-specific DNA-methyltransferase (adenine-specific) n=1 Tax=Aeromonas veronii TaxID=654 RepID=A0ABY3MRN6_AERVE|nr:N-6 DNA methylase [Aeromonas veronii]RDU86285.1 restriction endonuclease [Aeromonas veronii]RDU90174.1 restriction endonuclease [Aeromonas veronii]TEY52606.1 restriction endonuclease [Aeromonas veronii]TEY79943.1 restriction endonuclease [Aeromonas veronii]TYD47964.1 restriction endonuclease [Aeromonas veronii]
MSAPRPVEAEYLASAEAALLKAVGRSYGPANFELRLQVLEAASARFGGFDLTAFHEAFGVKSKRPASELLELAAPVASDIERSPIHPALALSVLAREVLHEQDRKSTGAYHTDFRLATRLAKLAAPKLTHKSKVIDPACGAGILLAALTHAVCGMDRAKTAHWLAHGVYAADLSGNSLRAALLALASFTDDVSILKAMRTRWYCGDSLMVDRNVWTAMVPEGFDAVIGNPPWEKVKLSRHEFLKSSGTKRHYGAQIHGLDEELFTQQRDEVTNYSRRLLARYPDLGNGEPDLYIAFTDLFFELCKEQGVVAALIPGGLIRSQGTRVMRQKIFDASQSVSMSIIDNRARFFAIDTRFKFLAVAFTKAGSEKSKREPITLMHERGTPTGLEITGTATIGRAALAGVRGDLSLPEVRNVSEWKLFSKIGEAGVSWEEPGYGWTPKFCREVDMTKERPKFLGCATPGALPLVEGRMVQAHRFGVKGHVSGTGRRALWEAYAIGCSRLAPQFWIRPSDVPRTNQHRANMLRVGFCDIAGQTNERSLMASLIPAGVVCGNKVPTILFPEDPSEERLLVWVSIANSFTFDWMLRRVLTTTVNYFLLQSVPMPKLAKDGLPWKRLVSAARELRILDSAGATRETYERMAQLRGEIDAEVAVAYGLDLKDMELVLQDFPLLDRGQVCLPGEAKSTITRDSALAAMTKRTGNMSAVWSHRVADARALGALAYVPSELALGGEEMEEEGAKSNG